MNSKQLLILIVVGVVLGGAGLYVRKSQDSAFKASTTRMGDRVLGDFDLTTVAGLRISSGSNSPVEILKKDNDWIVPARGGYSANFQSVGEFVRKLWELKVTAPKNISPSRLPILQLTKETGTTVELLDNAGKPIKSVILGIKHTKEGGDSSPFGGGGGFPDGRYVKSGDAVALVNDPLSNADSKASEWINKDFFKVEKAKSVSVKHLVDTNSFTLSRDSDVGEWKLEGATAEEKIDSGKTSGFSSILSYPSFNDLILDKKPEELGLDKPTVATVTTTEGFKYIVNIGKADGENYPLTLTVTGDFKREREPGKEEKPEDKEKLDKEFKEKLTKLDEKLKSEQALGKWTYQVSKWTVDQLLKNRHELFADKKTEEANDAPKPGGSPLNLPFPTNK